MMELVIIVSLHAMIIYQSCLLTHVVLLITCSTLTFTVVFNYSGVDEVYVGYLWTRKIVLGLEDLS